MKLKQLFALAAFGSPVLLTGCMSPTAYQQITGLNPNAMVGASGCQGSAYMFADASYLQFASDSDRQARAKCATENSGKAIVTDSEIRYSEFRDGYESACYFGGHDRTVILDRLSKGIGLVQPVLVLGPAGDAQIDEKSTQALINLMRTKLKLNVRPYADTLRYYRILAEYSAPQKTAQQALSELASGPVDPAAIHYSAVIARTGNYDYLVAPSQDIVTGKLTGQDVLMQKAFATVMSSAARTLDAGKKTFQPREIQELQATNQYLEQVVRRNASTLQLSFLLTERMKNYNAAEDSMIAKAVRASTPSGCMVSDLTANFANKQVSGAATAASDNKSVAERIGQMFQLNENGNLLSLEFTNEGLLRDTFAMERKRLVNLVQSVQTSVQERYRKINETLVPFSAQAFEQFKVTGYTKSKPL